MPQWVFRTTVTLSLLLLQLLLLPIVHLCLVQLGGDGDNVLIFGKPGVLVFLLNVGSNSIILELAYGDL
jgi:hypothetical protein